MPRIYPSQGLPEARKKARQASQNAFRHGLTTVRRSNPAYAPDVAELANAICEGDANPDLSEAALEFALAQVMLREIRGHKQFLFNRLLNPARFPTSGRWPELRYCTSTSKMKYALYDKFMLAFSPSGSAERTPEFENLVKAIVEEPRQRSPEAALWLALPELVRVARYERKAWRIWKRAFERLLQLRRATYSIQTDGQQAGLLGNGSR